MRCLSRSFAIETIKKAWRHGDHSSDNESLKALDHPASLFKTLKAMGIKVAICTSDCRSGTEEFLEHQNALSYVDMIVCGDDPDSVPKPDAHNALRICDVLGVAPDTAVMVGDTSADMEMGRAAKLGATVAVLTGVGDVEHLAPDADHVVPSISHVLDLVTSHKQRQYARNFYRKEVESLSI
jgi:choline dehydrogenase